MFWSNPYGNSQEGSYLVKVVGRAGKDGRNRRGFRKGSQENVTTWLRSRSSSGRERRKGCLRQREQHVQKENPVRDYGTLGDSQHRSPKGKSIRYREERRRDGQSSRLGADLNVLLSIKMVSKHSQGAFSAEQHDQSYI